MTLEVDRIQTETGGPVELTEQSASKAWANLNGTGTIAVRGALNIASVTDNGAGNYTFNLSNAMVNANYVVAPSVNGDANKNNRYTLINDLAATSFNQRTLYIASDNSLQDQLYVLNTVNGTLAQ